MFGFKKRLAMLDAYRAASERIDVTPAAVVAHLGNVPDKAFLLQPKSFALDIPFRANWKYAVFASAPLESSICKPLCDFAIRNYARGDIPRGRLVQSFIETTNYSSASQFYYPLLKVIFDASYNKNWELQDHRWKMLDIDRLPIEGKVFSEFVSNVRYVQWLGEEFKLTY